MQTKHTQSSTTELLAHRTKGDHIVHKGDLLCWLRLPRPRTPLLVLITISIAITIPSTNTSSFYYYY